MRRSDDGLELSRVAQRGLDDPLLGHLLRLPRRRRKGDGSRTSVDGPSALQSRNEHASKNVGGAEGQTCCAYSMTSCVDLKKSSVAASVMGRVW